LDEKMPDIGGLLVEINIENVNLSNVIKLLSRFQEFQETGYAIEKLDLNLQHGYFYTIQENINQFNYFTAYYLVLCIPAFFLTIFLVSFSLSLINEQRKKTFVLCKMRGVPNSYLFVIY